MFFQLHILALKWISVPNSLSSQLNYKFVAAAPKELKAQRQKAGK